VRPAVRTNRRQPPDACFRQPLARQLFRQTHLFPRAMRFSHWTDARGVSTTRAALSVSAPMASLARHRSALGSNCHDSTASCRRKAPCEVQLSRERPSAMPGPPPLPSTPGGGATAAAAAIRHRLRVGECWAPNRVGSPRRTCRSTLGARSFPARAGRPARLARLPGVARNRSPAQPAHRSY
jgi:hypothetical protein